MRLRNARAAGICSPLAKWADCVYFSLSAFQKKLLLGTGEELRAGWVGCAEESVRVACLESLYGRGM